jgi:hypothetical protein
MKVGGLASILNALLVGAPGTLPGHETHTHWRAHGAGSRPYETWAVELLAGDARALAWTQRMAKPNSTY